MRLHCMHANIRLTSDLSKPLFVFEILKFGSTLLKGFGQFLKRMTSTLTAIIFLHYWIATKLALEFWMKMEPFF